MEKLTELKASSLKRLNIDKPLSRLTRVDHTPYFQYLSYKANKLLNIFYLPTLRNTPSHNREGSMSEVTNYLELCAGKWGDGGWCLPPPLLPLWHHLIPWGLHLPTLTTSPQTAAHVFCAMERGREEAMQALGMGQGYWGGILGCQAAKHGLRSYQSIACARTGKWTNAAKQSPETDLHIYSYFIYCKITTGGKGSPFP